MSTHPKTILWESLVMNSRRSWMSLKTSLPLIYGRLTGSPLGGEEEWADIPCLLRYLRATKWNVEIAVKRVEKTLQWRREYRPTEISPEEVEPESVTGKQFFTGFDKVGRPLYYLVPRNENTKTYDRQLRYVVYNLEKGIALMPPSVEQLSIIIDYENMSMMSAPSVQISKKFLEVLGDHYPERLGQGFMINPSWYLWMFFKLLGPFLDPVTKSKIHFVNVSKQLEMNATGTKDEQGTAGWTNILFYVDPDQLPVAYGGTHNFVYDHKTYWKQYTAIKPAQAK
ncbi:CRAL-TRIO domain-containing protein [Chytridium lagenaria]|nr:CRAL-TRIO domain-containing protein [Chytridium lagenaria]